MSEPNLPSPPGDTVGRPDRTPRPDLPPLTAAVREAIESVLVCCWQAEAEDFELCDDEGRAAHVFRSMVVIDNWLAGTTHAPEDHLNFDNEERGGSGDTP